MLDAVFFNKSFRNGSSGRKIQHFGGEIKYGAEDPGLLFLWQLKISLPLCQLASWAAAPQ